MTARALGCHDRTRLVEATQCLLVTPLAPCEHLVARQVGLHVVFDHGLIGGVAVVHEKRPMCLSIRLVKATVCQKTTSRTTAMDWIGAPLGVGFLQEGKTPNAHSHRITGQQDEMVTYCYRQSTWLAASDRFLHNGHMSGVRGTRHVTRVCRRNRAPSHVHSSGVQGADGQKSVWHCMQLVSVAGAARRRPSHSWRERLVVCRVGPARLGRKNDLHDTRVGNPGEKIRGGKRPWQHERRRQRPEKRKGQRPTLSLLCPARGPPCAIVRRSVVVGS